VVRSYFGGGEEPLAGTPVSQFHDPFGLAGVLSRAAVGAVEAVAARQAVVAALAA